MFCRHIFTTKTLQTTFAKVFFVFIFCFVKHKYVKIFDVYKCDLSSSIKQQIYRVFKFLIWNINWKSQLTFIIKHANVYIVFHFNLAKIFFLHEKLSFIIIKFFSNFLSVFLNSFWIFFEGFSMSNMTP